MPRPATGQVIVDERRRSSSFGLRFRAYGQREYVTLGTAAEGWTRAKAQTELQNILADVRRGIWRPPVVEVVQAPREVPTFHVFASEWFERQKVEGGRRGKGLAPKGREDLQWRLSNHLLPAFAFRRLDQITVEDIDRYRLGKVREGKLGVTSINKTLTTLAAILEAAVEYELIDRNPARGRRRRLPAVARRRSWLDCADHISALTARFCRQARRGGVGLPRPAACAARHAHVRRPADRRGAIPALARRGLGAWHDHRPRRQDRRWGADREHPAGPAR